MSIPTQSENPNGFHAKYLIKKITGWRESKPFIYKPVTKPVDKGSEYFVMRLDEGGSDRNHTKACRIGIHAYADAIEPFIPQLAKDLRERYPLLD